MEMTTRSVEETRDVGRRIGERLIPGTVVLLVGDLGAGKTQLVKGIAMGLGLPSPDPVTSPTFVLLNQYEGRWPIQHYDLYRLDGVDLESLGFLDFRDDSVVLIEWGEKAGSVGEHLRVDLEVVGENARRIRFSAHGPAAQDLLAAVNLGA